MKTLLSTRREKFTRLVAAASDQPSEWLATALKDKTRNNGHMTALSRLACLRVLAFRNHGITPGLPYPQRKRAVRAALGV